MHLVLEHPGVFAAFASHSGDSYFRYAHIPAFATVQRTLEAARIRHRAHTSSAFERKPKRGAADYTTMEMLAYAAAYSPRSAAAYDLELPFERSTGELREDVFSRWLAFDPAERVVQGRDALARLRLRYLDCGRRDEYNLDIGARVVTERIRGLGLAGAPRGI